MFSKIKLLINRLGKRMVNNTSSVINISDKNYVENKISTWKSSVERMEQITGEKYYKGLHDILKRKRTVIGENGALTEVGNLPNNQIVDNQYGKMVDQKKNYLLGQPIVFTSENEQYNEALQQVFNKNFLRTLKNVGLDSLTGGIAWLHPYYDEEGNFKFKKFPAYEILPFWANKEHTKLKCAIRYYHEEERDGNKDDLVEKVDLYTPDGIYYFDLKNGKLVLNSEMPHSNYLTLETEEGEQAYNWTRIPLIPFKFNSFETPLINRCKSIQDAINLIMSDFVNVMEENAGGNSILILKNHGGENLGSFRRKLATYRAVKIETTPNLDGGIEKLEIEVNSENYEIILKALKRQLIENCRGFDAKDERMSNNPNQMNIQSAYTDLDLDAREMEAEYEAAFDELLWFVNQHLANSGVGNFENEEVDIQFNKDTLVNETEVMDMLTKAGVRIPNEILLEQVPWIDDVERAKDLLEEEEQKQLDIYGGALPVNGNKTDGEVDDEEDK